MNTLQFIDLLNMIYGKKPVDINKIQEYGLLAVKIGQVHALRLDFLPVETCRELSKLYQFNNEIPAENVLNKIDLNIYDKIDKKPIATASVGQVYKAKYKNKDVAIKIIKGDFKKKFTEDVISVRKFAKLILFFYPKLHKVFNPLGVLRHIEEYTLDELDLRKEIKGQQVLRDIYDKWKNKYDLSVLKFPKIYKNLSSANIMVSEFIPGETFEDLLTQKKLSYEKLLDLFYVHGLYVFRIGTFHGDIHPGNIMMHNDKMYFIDTGAISHASTRLSQGLLNFFESLGKWDYEKCAYFLNQMAEIRISGNRYEKFKIKFIDLYQDFTNSTVSQISLTKKMMQTIKLGVLNGMVFEDSMFPVIKSLMYLDGMVLRCNPEAVLLKDMQKFYKELKI